MSLEENERKEMVRLQLEWDSAVLFLISNFFVLPQSCEILIDYSNKIVGFV